jgi:threonine synthase
LKKLVSDGRVQAEDRVVLILTGHTLKDSDYTIHFHRNELLSAQEQSALTPAQAAESAALRKPPIVLEANRDTVLRTLESLTHQPAPVA